jgi:hypothetical protein
MMDLERVNTQIKKHFLVKISLMKSEKELNADILDITMKIQATYPELSKFIGEMPVKISNEDGSEINIKNLKDYYDSLEALLKSYDKTHSPDETTAQ